MFRQIFLALTLSILPATLLAQDEDGTDTPGNWIVTHQKAHGIWSTICDERANARDTTKRCYIRWVDVFSPRPEFAAQFIFVTAEEDGLQVAFGIEPGTLFNPDGFRIETMQGASWSTNRPGCLTGLACTFAGQEAEILLASMADGGTFVFDFVDRHGARQSLGWALGGFAAAMADFGTQRALRALP